MVVVVGAGPAGCVAAKDLADAGREVLLVERDPGHVKSCGGGLPFRAVERFEVPEELIDRKVRAMVMHGPGGKTIRCEASDGYYTAMLRRERLDAWLLERALASGVGLLRGSFESLRQERAHVVAAVRTEEGVREIPAHALLGADGVGSRVRAQIGSPSPPLVYTRQERLALAPTGEYEDAAHFWFTSHVSRSAYGWAFPKGDHLAVGLGETREYANQLARGMASLKAEIGPAAAEAEVLRSEGWRIPLERVETRVADRVMLLGDAAGYVAPFTGEGILYAMWSGALAARVLLENWETPTKERLYGYQEHWDAGHRKTWGTMRLIERVFLVNDIRRSAFVDYLAAPGVGRTLTDAWTARTLRRGPGLSWVGTPARLVGCLLRSYVRHLGGLRSPGGGGAGA